MTRRCGSVKQRAIDGIGSKLVNWMCSWEMRVVRGGLVIGRVPMVHKRPSVCCSGSDPSAPSSFSISSFALSLSQRQLTKSMKTYQNRGTHLFTATNLASTELRYARKACWDRLGVNGQIGWISGRRWGFGRSPRTFLHNQPLRSICVLMCAQLE